MSAQSQIVEHLLVSQGYRIGPKLVIAGRAKSRTHCTIDCAAFDYAGWLKNAHDAVLHYGAGRRSALMRREPFVRSD